MGRSGSTEAGRQLAAALRASDDAAARSLAERSGIPAALLTGSCLTAAPGLVPAVRDAMEYELCAGNWARAFELASALGDDGVAVPLLRPLGRLREPARGAERAGRNQPCPCGSGRKYKACCRVKDLESGTRPLADRAPTMYAMLATYAKRAPGRQVSDRLSVCALGAPQAAMLALDLAIFDGGIARRFLNARSFGLISLRMSRQSPQQSRTAAARGRGRTPRRWTIGVAIGKGDKSENMRRSRRLTVEATIQL